MTKTYFSIFLFMISISFLSCSEKDEDIWMAYSQTKCADPWNQSNIGSDVELIQAVEAYLEGEGITIINSQISIDETLSQACEACSCTTGKVIYIEVDEAFAEEMVEVGFY